jgi:hypothetical protein
VSALDRDHVAVRNALIKDGWTITHDPLRLNYKKKRLYVDLGAERLLAAERGIEKIAVEIKTFGGASDVADLEQAAGQYVVYRSLLKRTDPERSLVLAIPQEALEEVFDDALGEILLEDSVLKMFSFDPIREEIVEWRL